MTYRTQNGTGEQISLLGFGMMRLPREQEEVNALVDYALAHGINYFDTAPMYGGGNNETATGLALSRHPKQGQSQQMSGLRRMPQEVSAATAHPHTHEQTRGNDEEEAVQINMQQTVVLADL